MSNEPKVLVEFNAEEAKWLLDRLHEEWGRSVAAGAIATGDNVPVVADHKKMAIELKNRIEENGFNQGFGFL